MHQYNRPPTHFMTGQFLLAMPTLDHSFFDGALVFICQHDADGAFGLIVNRLADIQLKDVFEELELSTANTIGQQDVYIGGPVSLDSGFVLHHNDKTARRSGFEISPELALTTSKDILRDLASGCAPSPASVLLGYSGWSAGQIEQEIADNLWLHVPACNDILFETPVENRYRRAAENAGINLDRLSCQAGHA